MLLWLLALTGILYIAIRELPTTKRVQIFILWFVAHELLLSLFMQQFNIATAAMILATFTCIEKEKDGWAALDRKSTRLNSSHQIISYAVFCLKKKKKNKLKEEEGNKKRKDVTDTTTVTTE